MAKVDPSSDRPARSVLEAAVKEPQHLREWDDRQAWTALWLNNCKRSKRIAIEKPRLIWRPCQCSTRGTTRCQLWRNLTWTRSYKDQSGRTMIIRTWVCQNSITKAHIAAIELFANLFRTSLMLNCQPQIWVGTNWAIAMLTLPAKWSQS